MLIDSPRITARDRAHWDRLAHYDDALSRDPRLDTLVKEGRAAVEEFAAGGDYVVSTSWGKDSVVACHLALLADPSARLVWARARDVETPECEAVRDAFLALHPHAQYEEREYVFRVPLRFEPDHEHADHQDALAETLPDGRYVSGVRAQESRMRRISIGHRGMVTPNTCRPVARWDATHVFAYAHREGLPVHPAYAMTQGGHHDRAWLRVHPLGTAAPAQSAVHGRPMDAWEDTYYSDVLAAARRARAPMWETP